MSSQLHFVLFMLSAVLLAAGVSFLATPLVKLLAYKVSTVLTANVPRYSRSSSSCQTLLYCRSSRR